MTFVGNSNGRASLDRTENRVHIGGARNRMPDPTGKGGQIVALMEQRLTLGYYEPGQMLSFNMLAEEFGVSRQPVSTAILHLRAAGYVDVIPHVGCRVMAPSPREIDDYFLVSSKIESAVVALAAERYEDPEGAELLAIAPPAELASLDAQPQRKAYIAYIDRFHEQIWHMARAPLLEGKIGGIRRLSNFYLWQGTPKLAPAAAKQLSRERTAIAKAIVARDAKLASELVEAHIRHKPALAGLIQD
ncbi:GntR family transcriptional regulator [Nevskia sp.]|uniref:GntR family transcriptional regulator n=1 Tax=Nevskia sp. TaxID=1929292 RepID=UPI0025F04651|nr:GntR family transcriptional regulator [Nevskia sp.]